MCTELLREFDFLDLTFLLQTLSLAVLTLVILFGNILVILAVLCSLSLRNSVTSCLILSLAVADLCVGALVLPFSTAHETLGFWIFGGVWCQIWLAIDVWMCTASIYNLVAISIDRYIAISKPLTYAIVVTPARGWLMIAAVWTLSFAVCFPPMISWSAISDWGIADDAFYDQISASDSHLRLLTEHNLVKRNVTIVSATTAEAKAVCTCTPMNNSPGYIVYSALMSFYIPMIAIGIIYTRIYLTAKGVSNSISNGYLPVITSAKLNRASAVTNSSGTTDHHDTNTLLRTPLVKQRTLPCENQGSGTSKLFRRQPPRPPPLGEFKKSLSQNSSSTHTPAAPEDGLRIHYGKGRPSTSTLSLASKSSRPRGSECSSCSGVTSISNHTVFGAAANAGNASTAVLKNLMLEKWCDFMVRTSQLDRRFQQPLVPVPPSTQCYSPTPSCRTPEFQSRPSSRTAVTQRLCFKASHSPGESNNGCCRDSVEEALNAIRSEAAACRTSNGWNRRAQRLLALVNRRSRFGDGASNCTRTLQRREIRAAKTVAIVTGCFIASWLGFAVIYLLQAFPFCQGNSGAQSCIPAALFSLTFWLGYVNSALNPLIYALFSKQFRRSFKRLLCLRRSRTAKKRQSYSWDKRDTSDFVAVG